MTVMIMMGTRPEVIKMAPVIKALQSRTETIVCTTGQHREMLDQMLSNFDMKADIYLDTMVQGQSLSQLASQLFSQINAVFQEKKPEIVLVQGDTLSALIGGMCAYFEQIPFGHVEAGLRTGDLNNPFPEEANRSLLARIATWHFAPTARAAGELIKEGVPEEKIYITGNTVVDSIKMIETRIVDSFDRVDIGGKGRPKIFVTCHRRENQGDVLTGICAALANLAAIYKEFDFIFPVHLNPKVRETVYSRLDHIQNMYLMDPLDYHASLALLKQSTLVISDSGGIQEEAPTFGVPVIVMRSHTERSEGVDAGFAVLAGSQQNAIEDAVHGWLKNPEKITGLNSKSNPYGDGHAGERISAILNRDEWKHFDG